MNHTPDHHHLLADVLAEESPADLRTIWLDKTLRLAARQRRLRRLRRGSAVLLVLAGLAGIIQWREGAARGVSHDHKKNVAVVHTQPLATRDIVSTQLLPKELRMTTFAAVQIVRTDYRKRDFRLLSDQELLAMVDSKAAVLVHRPRGVAELIFANPGDQKGFPLD